MSKLEDFAILSISLDVHNDSEWHVAKKAYMDGFLKAIEVAKELDYAVGADEIIKYLEACVDEEA